MDSDQNHMDIERALAKLGQAGEAREAPVGGLAICEERFSDRALVRFAGLLGAVSVEQAMAAFGVGRSAAYRRVAACIDQGLLERLALLREEPSLLRATRAGLRYAGLDLQVAAISPGTVEHWLRCASTALHFGALLGFGRVLTERELRHREQAERRPLFSAKVGELSNGAPRLHRPDLALTGFRCPVAVEVELTPKAPHRLEALIRAWRRASWVGGVLYLCEPGVTQRGVERAVARARAEERIAICGAVGR